MFRQDASNSVCMLWNGQPAVMLADEYQIFVNAAVADGTE